MPPSGKMLVFLVKALVDFWSSLPWSCLPFPLLVENVVPCVPQNSVGKDGVGAGTGSHLSRFGQLGKGGLLAATGTLCPTPTPLLPPHISTNQLLTNACSVNQNKFSSK